MAGGETHIIDNSDSCNRCWGYDKSLNEQDRDSRLIKGREKMLQSPNLWTGTIEDWLQQTGVREQWKITDRWYGICDRINLPEIREVTRWMVGLLTYNFDSPWIAAGLSPEEARAKRPSSIDEHMSRIEYLADCMVASVNGSFSLSSMLEVLAEHGLDASWLAA